MQTNTERDPLFIVQSNVNKVDSQLQPNGKNSTHVQIKDYSSCKDITNHSTMDENDEYDEDDSKSVIKIYHIILLSIGQIFNYLSIKSYKIYSGYIHSDFNISYKFLTYTVFASSYVSIINLIFSSHPLFSYVSSLFPSSTSPLGSVHLCPLSLSILQFYCV